MLRVRDRSSEEINGDVDSFYKDYLRPALSRPHNFEDRPLTIGGTFPRFSCHYCDTKWQTTGIDTGPPPRRPFPDFQKTICVPVHVPAPPWNFRRQSFARDSVVVGFFCDFEV